MMELITGILCGVGFGLILWMWALNQLQRINQSSLKYVACNVIGAVMLIVAAMIDYYTDVMDGWVVQVLGFVASTWLGLLIFRRRK